MVARPVYIIKALTAALGAFALSGCLTIQAIEPVIEAPEQFRGNVTVAVEFVVPGTIGIRCAERGATFLGLPGINSGACSDRNLITMIDPCYTLTAGPYASVLCDGIKQQRQDEAVAKVAAPAIAAPAQPQLMSIAYSPSASRSPIRAPKEKADSGWDNIAVEFIRPDAVEERCAERGAKIFEADAAMMACADRMLLTIANPCGLNGSSWYIRTLCHEIGHANGWAADHHSNALEIKLKSASESPQALALAAKARPTAPIIAAPVAVPAVVLLPKPDEAVSDTSSQAVALASADVNAKLMTFLVDATSISNQIGHSVSIWGANTWNTAVAKALLHNASVPSHLAAIDRTIASTFRLGALRGRSQETDSNTSFVQLADVSAAR